MVAEADEVQIGLLFSTDPSIGQNGFVPLVDDRHLQNAENITPLIRSEKVDEDVRDTLDRLSAHLSSEAVTALARTKGAAALIVIAVAGRGSASFTHSTVSPPS